MRGGEYGTGITTSTRARTCRRREMDLVSLQRGRVCTHLLELHAGSSISAGRDLRHPAVQRKVALRRGSLIARRSLATPRQTDARIFVSANHADDDVMWFPN